MLDQNIVTEAAEFFRDIKTETGKVLTGQENLLDGMLFALLTNGHILVEGLPGLAKTLAVKTLSKVLNTTFKRIQFTPDLMPADITGMRIYHHHSGQFAVEKGPVFCNLILADEINRAPAKVQSALLEAMQEKTVTIAGQTLPLPDPFMVMATQNPIEHEGTYSLPEAQIDRFILKLNVDYPDRAEEEKIVLNMANTSGYNPELKEFDIAKIKEYQKLVNEIHIDERINNYIMDIVRATRPETNPEFSNLQKIKKITDIENLVETGSSPRGAIALSLISRCAALLDGRNFVMPTDVKKVAIPVLQHRIIPTYSAESEGFNGRKIIEKIVAELIAP